MKNPVEVGLTCGDVFEVRIFKSTVLHLIEFINGGDGCVRLSVLAVGTSLGYASMFNAYIIVVVAWIQLITGSPCEVSRVGPLAFP